MPSLRDVRAAGRRAGLNAASWVFDGNTPDEAYRRALQGIEGGDPAVFDRLAPAGNGWLSGEYAGESVRELLGLTGDESDERADELASAYEDAADAAYWTEVERIARTMAPATRGA